MATLDNQPAGAAAQTNDAPARTVRIEGKQFGRGGKALFPNFEMALPEDWQGGAVSLRDLLIGVVRAQVAAFQTRQDARTVLQALSAQQIADGAARGKINHGDFEGGAGAADADEAVRAALLAFEDGLFFVFVDDEQKTELGETFAVGAGTRVMFLRLVALAGG